MKLNNQIQAEEKDLIQSFNVASPVDTRRGSYVGYVTKVEIDQRDGIEYVYYRAEYKVTNGVKNPIEPREFRAPNNGQPTLMGRRTDGIHVMKKLGETNE